MSYEVTATRKRPQTFDELAGQEFVVSTLKNSIKTGRIAHAYLFSGPRGVGKTSAARILAKALNCQEGPNETPCGTCSSCEEISRGTSLDVIEIDGASNTSVNDVREIKDEVLFAPNSSRYKIYIIDEVHMLSNSAFNALLKTIEEPPPYIVFIFATTEIHKVPATIRSRCQQFNFRLLSADTIKESLQAAALDIEIEAEDDALFWIAKEATGSLRDAYTLFDQIVAFSEGSITLKNIREKLGLVGFDRINELVEVIASGDTKKSLEATAEILKDGVSVEQFIIDLAEYFRNTLFLKSGIERQAILGYAPERFSRTVLENFSVEQLEQGVNLLLILYRNIRFSLNQQYELELCISRLTTLKDYISPSTLMEQIRKLKRDVSGMEYGVEESPGTLVDQIDETEEAVTDPQNLETEDTSGDIPWDRIVAGLKKKKMALSAALEKAQSWKLADEVLTISFPTAYQANCVRDDLRSVAEKAEEVLGRKVTIDIKVEKQVKLQEEETKHDEQVELVRRVFRGEIIDK